LNEKGEKELSNRLGNMTFAQKLLLKKFYKIRISSTPYTVEFVVSDGVLQSQLRSDSFPKQVQSDLESEGLKADEDFKIEVTQ
jgi:hypothetical protein